MTTIKEKDCESCNDKLEQTDMCNKIKGGYLCTLRKGHKGEHIACGGDELHALKVWKQ